MIYGFIIKKVVLEFFVGSVGNLGLHQAKLILGTITLAQLDVHGQALFSDDVMEGSLLLSILATCINLSIGTAKQIESLFPIVILVIQSSTTSGTLHANL